MLLLYLKILINDLGYATRGTAISLNLLSISITLDVSVLPQIVSPLMNEW